MKCTSYLISKKLKEAGYIGKTDLETILEALPNLVDADSIYSNEYRGFANLQINCNKIIGYNDYRGVFLISCTKEENESLADTAGRLWLELKEKNLL